MPNRVIALFIAFVLLWSGLNTIEGPRAFAQPSTEQTLVVLQAGGHAAKHEGSVEHHHLDDLPSQALSESPSETPGLLQALPRPRVHSLTLELPRNFASAAAGPPFLAGPLRPPCSVAITG